MPSPSVRLDVSTVSSMSHALVEALLASSLRAPLCKNPYAACFKSHYCLLLSPCQLMLTHSSGERCLAWHCKGLWYTCVALSALVTDLWKHLGWYSGYAIQ